MRVAKKCRTFGLVLFTAPFLMGGCQCGSKPPAATSVAITPASPAEKAKAPLVKKAELVDWCKEHGVPESACTRCNSELIDDFKKKNDWCTKHDLPDSQCVECHPELKAKLDALKPKDG